MTRPRRFLTRMLLFLLAVLAVTVVLFPQLKSAFLANPALNGMIVGVLVIGIGFIFRQVMMLGPEVTWIESYRRNQPGLSVARPPELLGPMATMLGERQDRRVSLSAMSMRSLLDSIASRLEESRDISRYFIGILILLGLLGTFWGLLETIGSVGHVIGGLSIEGGDLGQVFTDLKRGLESPLSGMATAFSSSLFGLAGSLVLGFLDLQGGAAQNRFYNELEEWLSGLTRLSGPGLAVEGDQPIPAFLHALMEQTADSLDKLQRIMARGEEERRVANANLLSLNEKLSSLADQMRTEQNLMLRLATAQVELKPILQKLADAPGHGAFDEVTRGHVRNIEVYVARLVEETAVTRQEMVEELRSEIRLVARTIAALAEGADERG